MALTKIKVAAMSANSVDSDQYVDASIDTAHIGNLQVTNAKLADDAVDSDEIAAGAIDTAHIADNQVNGDKLADNIDIAGTLDVTGAATFDAAATIIGGASIGGANIGHAVDTGTQIYASQGIATVTSGATDGITIHQTGVATAGVTMTANGSITTTSTIRSKGNPNSGTAEGSELAGDSGVIACSATGSQKIWRGFKKDVATETSSITADGAATFAKDLQVTDGFVGAASTSSSAKTFISSCSGTENAIIRASGAATFTTVSDTKGDVRKIIQNTQGSTYTLDIADAGKHILASGTVTIPNNIFSAGDAVTIVNNTAGDLTITKTITTMYMSTDATSANRTLATRGMATILFASGTVAYISGAGLS